jgi:hypothetical protein
MTSNTADYAGIIRRLARPTLAQTERFARYVSGAHSWYKHLPVSPKVPFVFYLDPGAGMNLVRTSTGETALVAITDESNRFHYTWQKTEDYRRRFGFWNYHANYGTSFFFSGEGGMVSTAGAGLKVFSQSGDWADLPSDLAENGTALVSALVHPAPNFAIWARDPGRFGLLESANTEDAVWSVLRQEQRNQPALPELVKALPAHLLESSKEQAGELSEWTGLWPTEKGWDWPGDSWLEQLRKAGLEEKTISWVVKSVEVEKARTLWTSMERKKTHPGAKAQIEARVRLLCAVTEERGRQLAAMTEAMGRFLEAVYR